MSNRIIMTLLALAAALLVVPAPAHAGLDIVATVPDLAAIAKEIGGSKASVTSLSLHTQDPHWVDAKPSLALDVSRADLLLAVGAELEIGWLPTLLVGARNPKVQRGGSGYLECAGTVSLLDVPAGPVDRSQGDIHPTGNPHYLHDPRAAAVCARSIAARMSELDPGGSSTYKRNLDDFLARLDARRELWEQRMARHRGAPVITYHRSWAYLLAWLGLREAAALEPKPGIAPSPRHVAQVIGLGRSKGVKVLLQEAYLPGRTGQLVASKIGARQVSAPGGTNFHGGQSYIEHIDEIISMLDKGFSK